MVEVGIQGVLEVLRQPCSQGSNSWERQLPASKGNDHMPHCGCIARHSPLSCLQSLCLAGRCEAILRALPFLKIPKTPVSPGILSSCRAWGVKQLCTSMFSGCGFGWVVGHTMKELLFHNWCRREARPKSGTAWAGEEVLHVLSRAVVSTLWLQGSNWTLPGPSGAMWPWRNGSSLRIRLVYLGHLGR